MGKQQFIFNGRRYIAPSKKEAYNFISYWGTVLFPKGMRHLNSSWKIEHVELAPSWAQLIPFDDLTFNKVEYETSQNIIRRETHS